MGLDGMTPKKYAQKFLADATATAVDQFKLDNQDELTEKQKAKVVEQLEKLQARVAKTYGQVEKK